MTARPKDVPWRSEPYRRLVASMPCIRCRVEGYTQAAHADLGKGMGIKSGDETCYPLCGSRPGVAGCHEEVGRHMTREMRRKCEAVYSDMTRAMLREECERRGIKLP